MNRETSLYLDVVRFLAAMVVFIGHVSGARFTGGFLWQFSPFMTEAVTVFFVLSGFVIGYATDKRENTATSYAISRAARICSVALPALIFTFALDAIGRSVRPDLYSSAWGYVATGQIWQFISGFLFISQIWFLDVPQGSDLPYWSLGYEVWYYVIFGIAMFTPVRQRVAATLAVLVFVGPAIAAMFPLWLLGWFSYRLCARYPLNRTLGALLAMGSVAGWVLYETWVQRHGPLLDVVPAFLRRPDLAQNYLVGLLFATHLVGFHGIAPVFGPVLGTLARPIRWTAGATFTLYLFHLPVAQFLITQVPWPPADWATRLVILCGTFVVMFAIAEVTERRKDVWRLGFTALLGHMSLKSHEVNRQ